jgi:hypothetical protein
MRQADGLRICVMSTGGKGKPGWFFNVANWRKPEGHWNFGPVPDIQVQT